MKARDVEQDSPSLYHERQSFYKCGVHAVNNLLGEKAFCVADFERFATELSPGGWLNPHKSVLGLGNYDINVMEFALKKRGIELHWHDNRKDFASVNLDNCVGLIVNSLSISWMAALMGSRHWIAVRRLGDAFWNNDSMLKAPRKFKGRPQLDKFITNIIEEHEGYCLIASTAE